MTSTEKNEHIQEEKKQIEEIQKNSQELIEEQTKEITETQNKIDEIEKKLSTMSKTEENKEIIDLYENQLFELKGLKMTQEEMLEWIKKISTATENDQNIHWYLNRIINSKNNIENYKNRIERIEKKIDNASVKETIDSMQKPQNNEDKSKPKVGTLKAKGSRPLRTKKTPIVNTKKSKVGTFLKKGLQKVRDFVGTIGLRVKSAATDIGIKAQNANRKIIITRNKINQKIVTTIDTARSKVGNFKKNIVDRFKKAAQKIKNAFSVNEEEKQKLIARLNEKKENLNRVKEENRNLYEQGKFKNLTRTRTRSGYVSTTILAILAVSIVGLLVAYWTLLMVK